MVQKPNTKAGRVAQLMEDEGIGVDRMMEMCGVSDATVYRWLNNTSQPYDKYLQLIAEKTGYALRWLKTGEGPRRLDKPAAGSGALTLPAELAALVDEMAGGDVTRFVELVRRKTSAPASPEEKRRAREDTATPFGEAQRRLPGLGQQPLVKQDEGPIEKAAEIPGVRHEAYGQFLFGYNVAIYQRKNGPIVIDWTGELPRPESDPRPESEPKRDDDAG
jgi:transcriptional regulator with XRE-family HTH domain